MRVVAGPETSKAVAAWVAERIPFVGSRGFGNAVGIGVVDKTGRPMAGVVFHDYQPGAQTIQLSIAADTPRWATKSVIRQILSYPFEEIGLFKVWVATELKNDRARRLAEGIGFIREATLRHQFGKKNHAVILSMTLPEFGEKYGSDHVPVRPAVTKVKNDMVVHT